MEKRNKQVLGIAGIVFVILFLVVSPRYIGEYLGVSPVKVAFALIIIYFLADQFWKRKDALGL